MRTIQEGQATRVLDPESESEAELLDDPCEAVLVGLEHGGKPRALATDPCNDQSTGTAVRLLESDRTLSDVRGRATVRLCDHHRQLYIAACSGRKCSVQTCYEKVDGARQGVALCIKHLSDVGSHVKARKVSWQEESEFLGQTDQSDHEAQVSSSPKGKAASAPRRRRSASAEPRAAGQQQLEGKLQEGPCMLLVLPQCLQRGLLIWGQSKALRKKAEVESSSPFKCQLSRRLHVCSLTQFGKHHLTAEMAR